MSTWPATLPQSPLIKGFGESRADPTLRSQMDIGVDKVRRRYTAVSTIFDVQFLMTATQLDILDTFYIDTLLDGAESFDWVHPRSGASVTARFRGPYSVTALGNDYFSVNCIIEELP